VTVRPRSLLSRLMVHSDLWSSAGLVFVGNLASRALGFLFPVVVARATNEDGFAQVYFCISTGWFVSELVLTSFPTALARTVAADEPDTHGGWVTSALAGGIPLLIASLVAGVGFAEAAHEPPLSLSFVVIGLTFDAYYYSFLRGLGRFGLLVLYRIGANLLQIVLLLVFVLADMRNPTGIIALYSFVYLIPIAVIEGRGGPLFGLLRHAPPPVRSRVVSLARFAIPSMISGTAYAGILGLDVFFVRVFARDAFADYGAARVLAIAMTYFPFAVATVLLPRVAAASMGQRFSLLRRAVVASTAITVIGALAYAIIGPFVLEVAFPPSYGGAEATLKILPGAIGLLGIYLLLNDWWLGLGRPWVPAGALTFGALVGSGAQTILTPAYGAVGASFSVAIGTLSAFVLLGSATLRLWWAERDIRLAASQISPR
jgi:O-antigen/teichoic acid export membrane protein